MADAQVQAPAQDGEDQPQSLFDKIKSAVQADPSLRSELEAKAAANKQTLDTYIEDNQQTLASKVGTKSAASAPTGTGAATASGKATGDSVGAPSRAPGRAELDAAANPSRGPLGRLSDAFQQDQYSGAPASQDNAGPFPGKPEGSGAPSNDQRGPKGGLKAQPFTMPGSESNTPPASPQAGQGGIPYKDAGNPNIPAAGATQTASTPPPSSPTNAGSSGAPDSKPATVADATKRAAGGGQGGKPTTPPPATDAPTPDDTTRRLQALADKAGDSKDYQSKLSQLDGLASQYRQAFQQTQDRIQKQELAEKMGHALAQLGAGIQGQRTGVDTVSGLKFDKTDWTARYKQALDELKANLDDLKEQRGAATQTYDTQQREAGEAGRELGRESTQRADTAAREAGETKRERMRNATSLATTKEIVEGRKDVQGMKGDTAQKVQELKGQNAARVQQMRSSLKGLDTKQQTAADQALGGVQLALDAYAQGDKKEGDRLMNVWGPKASGFVPQARISAAVKQAQDSSGWFDSNDASGAKATLGAPAPRGGAATPAAPAGGQSGQMVRMRDPKTGEERMVKPEAVQKYKDAGAEVVN